MGNYGMEDIHFIVNCHLSLITLSVSVSYYVVCRTHVSKEKLKIVW